MLLSVTDFRVEWRISSALRALYMCASLWRSHVRISDNERVHGDIDRIANRLTATGFMLLVVLQLFNALLWGQFWPFLAALMLNLAGAAMQFARLIRSAFHSGEAS